MGRTSAVDDASVFAAVGELVARSGSLKLHDVVALTGVSIGSLYHRYESREGLLAHTWLDAVTAFQAKFLAALDGNDAQAGERAAMATPRFCRAEPNRARVLVCCRREEMLAHPLASPLQAQIDSINTHSTQRLKSFARANAYAIDACQLGLVAYPVAAVRLYLPGRKIPKRVDDYVAAAFRSAVTLPR